jgi:hypothetical protein
MKGLGAGSLATALRSSGCCRVSPLFIGKGFFVSFLFVFFLGTHTAVSQAAVPVVQDPPDPGAVPVNVVEEHPKLALRGFSDVNFAASDDAAIRDGFLLGQFVLHFSSPLGRKISFFGETSFTALPDRFSVEVERLSLRYDFDDRFKISGGRFHTPVNYWNTAFHHGLWLQTTISRPEMIKGGGTFQPVHLVGVIAEGIVSSPAVAVGYNVGFGNGRDAHIERGGDAGDTNTNRAWLAKIYARPSSLFGLEVGGSLYHDVINHDESRIGERIVSAYIALSRENPEIIAEFADVHHTDEDTGLDYDSRGFYAQVAYRPDSQPRWKPYYRFEKLVTADDEPVLGDLSVTLSTAGLRYELSEYAAIKGEYRYERRRTGRVRSNGFFLQAAWTF